MYIYMYAHVYMYKHIHVYIYRDKYIYIVVYVDHLFLQETIMAAYYTIAV